ncbi:helix-turn-helix domain-containing protein [Elstera cyanobacteriorum]|uniref:helix-turn-helix domain-containing protein n=1 Tax=Elstera cyanobacteriorum TaxID=2022747 RepID=UPI002357C5DB|nr:helix-turn-helix transcriptional regulator [Elstera cyanobacteriorum]MCK6441483.1 helix-turn-helix domain-containing protein [Elstera cyanobacteriorum]
MYSHPQQGKSPETVELRKRVGVWLQTLREARGLSQRQLAVALGIDYYTFISQVESGRGRIPPDRYAAWAGALGVELKPFVRVLMRHYDPMTYECLFDDLDSALPGFESLKVGRQ